MQTNEEEIDILDENGEFTGQKRPRSEVHRLGLWHRSVHIWIKNSDDRILLQRRSLTKDSNPGLWDISAAGHISAGQTSLAAATREVFEEVGLNISPDRLVFLFEDKDQCTLNNNTFVDKEFHDVYMLSIDTSETALLKPDPVEVEELCWMSPHEFIEKRREFPQLFVNHNREYALLADTPLFKA